MKSLLTLKKTSLEIYNHRVNGTILDAIKQYEARGVPLKQLLSDYNDVISGSNIKEAINPWEYLYKGKKKLPVVSGVSVAEALFNTSAMSLYKQKPIEVIKGIYYRNKIRNDSGIEKIFLDSFLEQVQTQKILILNPSPFVVEYTKKLCKDVCYVVADQTMAELYSKQYKTSDFFSFSSRDIHVMVDIIVILTHQADMNMLERMMEIITGIEPEKIYSILQTRLLDNKESLFWTIISNCEYNIRDIVVMPRDISNSSPRNKCFVSLTRESDFIDVVVQQAKFNAKDKSLSFSSGKIEISKAEIYRHNTIKSTLKEALSQASNKLSKISTYSSAKNYEFSKEICVSYAIYSDKKGMYGKAYYAAIKNTQLPEIRGKALTPRIEKGLRGKSEAIIVKKMENFPYVISQVIVKDIVKCYINCKIPITLKTLWFCLREDLKKNYSYDDREMIEVFSRHTALCNLYMNKTSGQEILEAVSELYEAGEEVKILDLLKEINRIVTKAIGKGYLAENRVLPLIPAAQNRASKRQAEVRQALSKRSFEDEEEQKIMDFVLPLCVEYSLYLAVAIRLLAGVSIREVCALTWNDFSYDTNTAVYKLSITKFTDSDGKILSHALEDNWEKFRVLPLSQTLGQVIEERRQYLLDRGLDSEAIKDYPIILARESFVSMLKGHSIDHCKPAVIAKKCREAVLKAEIEPHMIFLPENGAEIETDINSYNGDIYKTNFRDKAINTAGYGLDELHYYLGLKKPDTFSQHYCDYTNDYVQLIMARKLDRWENSYLSKVFVSNQEECKDTIVFKSVEDGVPYAEIDISNKESQKDVSSSLSIESEYGFKVMVATRKMR